MTSSQLSPRARALCAALREARQASGIGMRELGRMLDIRNSDISLWENGHRVPNVETVATILGALHVSPDERGRILDLARHATDPHWLSVGVNGIPQQLAAVVESERAATSITEWIPVGIPGLVQTLDYTRELTKAADFHENDIELRVMVSASRREIITRRDPVHFTALIGEAIFHDRVGSSEIMVEQCRFLVELAARPNVVIHIVPQGIGWNPGWAGPFVLYEFPDASPVVHFEHLSSGAFVSAEHDVDVYRKAIERLRTIAMDEPASIAFIGEAVNKMESVR